METKVSLHFLVALEAATSWTTGSSPAVPCVLNPSWRTQTGPCLAAGHTEGSHLPVADCSSCPEQQHSPAAGRPCGQVFSHLSLCEGQA